MEFLYVVVLSLAKVSILLFYLEIFAVPQFRTKAYVAIGLCIAWLIANLLIVAFQCSPVRAMWTIASYSTGKCLTYPSQVMGSELTNIVIDVVILVLPLNEIRGLQMPRAKKIAVAAALMTGGG